MGTESVTLDPTEQSLVGLALREHARARQDADRALDDALAPIRARYGVVGVMQLAQGAAGYTLQLPRLDTVLTPA